MIRITKSVGAVVVVIIVVRYSNFSLLGIVLGKIVGIGKLCQVNFLQRFRLAGRGSATTLRAE